MRLAAQRSEVETPAEKGASRGALRVSGLSKGIGSSPGWTRTNNPPVNSRMLCQLSYRGRQRARSVAAHRNRAEETRSGRGRRTGVPCAGPSSIVVVGGCLPWHRPRLPWQRRARASRRCRSPCARTGFYAGAVDGISGRRPVTRCSASSASTASARPGRSAWRRAASSASSGRALLGQRQLATRARRLGRRIARVPPPRLRASGEARGREVRRRDRRCAPPVPAAREG